MVPLLLGHTHKTVLDAATERATIFPTILAALWIAMRQACSPYQCGNRDLPACAGCGRKALFVASTEHKRELAGEPAQVIIRGCSCGTYAILRQWSNSAEQAYAALFGGWEAGAQDTGRGDALARR